MIWAWLPRFLLGPAEQKPAMYVCPCEGWQLEAPLDWPLDDVEAALMEHFVDCPVAQADIITRGA